MTDHDLRMLLDRVEPQRLAADLDWLAGGHLPHRKLNACRPGQSLSTLAEADAFLTTRLESLGWSVTRREYPVQAFRCDATKPKAQQYSTPLPDDPWYPAANLLVDLPGTDPDAPLVLALAHKDSQSWVDSPGAGDNAIGTVCLLELARLLVDTRPRGGVRLLWCNEEHRPWTSTFAAQEAVAAGELFAAVINLDGPGVKGEAELAAGAQTNVTVYTRPEGEALAALMAELNVRFDLGLDQRSACRERPGDDDGSFVIAGYGATVLNIGSWPYAHRWYHHENDRPETIDVGNAARTVQLTLAALLTVADA